MSFFDRHRPFLRIPCQKFDLLSQRIRCAPSGTVIYLYKHPSALDALLLPICRRTTSSHVISQPFTLTKDRQIVSPGGGTTCQGRGATPHFLLAMACKTRFSTHFLLAVALQTRFSTHFLLAMAFQTRFSIHFLLAMALQTHFASHFQLEMSRLLNDLTRCRQLSMGQKHLSDASDCFQWEKRLFFALQSKKYRNERAKFTDLR